MSERPGTDRSGRPDRLRELLDAVLAEPAGDLAGMADHAHTSRFHFARQVSRGARESPVAMRRRVDLERAAWGLRAGHTVTETAWEAGYASLEGFTRAYQRAFGHAPSATPIGQRGRTDHWLPAPNGIHFHAPASLWIATADPTAVAGSTGSPDVTGSVGGERIDTLLVHHDVADLRSLVQSSRQLDSEQWTQPRMPGLVLLHWAGPEESVARLLSCAVAQLEVWLAAIDGREHPTAPEPHGGPGSAPSPDDLLQRLDRVGPRWLAMVADVEQRGAWGDRLIDALCDPPESFVLGSILAHVVTFNSQRRGIVRSLLRQDGAVPADDDGDPIMWLRHDDADPAD